MPLTRRVQVFIGEEASAALDRIVARGLSITEAVERGLLRIDPKFLPEQVERSPERTQANEWQLAGSMELNGDLDESPVSTFNSPEVAKKKAARAGRKGALRDALELAARKKIACPDCQGKGINADESGMCEVCEGDGEIFALADRIANAAAGGLERKGKLAESVKEALPPAGINSERIIQQQPGTYCPKHRPKYCEPDCPHRVSA